MSDIDINQLNLDLTPSTGLSVDDEKTLQGRDVEKVRVLKHVKESQDDENSVRLCDERLDELLGVKNENNAPEIDAEITRLQGLEAMKLLRERRSNLLSRSDWRANSDVTMSDAWKTYRQALRDLPASSTPKLDSNYDLDLTSVTWPTEPS